MIPHLTVSESRSTLDIRLPIACRAHEIALIEEQDDEQWTTRAVFPLAQSGVA